MGIFRNYRDKHTVYYSHYQSIGERWAVFKAGFKMFFWGAVFAALIIVVLASQK